MARQTRIVGGIRESGAAALVAVRLAALLRIGILASIACTVVSGQFEGLFSEHASGGDVRTDSGGTGSRTPVPYDELAIRSREVDIDFGKLAATRNALLQRSRSGRDTHSDDHSGITMSLNLFHDATFGAVFEETRTTSAGYSLSGRIEGDDFSTVSLVVHDDIVFGSVGTSRATYWIRSAPGAGYWVSEIDPSRFIPDDEPVIPPAKDPQ